MPNLEPNAEPTLGHDDEDVEGHGLAAETEESPRATDEESDDVEGHVLGAQPNIAQPNQG